MRRPVAAFLVTWVITLGISSATADDWTAVRLRGGVFALENGAWTQLVRGSVVSDDRVIKSAPGGRVTLVRGAEAIELGPDTTAQISDRGGFTTVYNHEGTVGVDAEARNVQHFSVQTPFLAAVVKGTAFVVQTSETASTVSVARGTVEVDDERYETNVNVSAGQQVTSSNEAPITAATVVAASSRAPVPPAPAALQPTVNPTNARPNNSDAEEPSGQPAANASPGNQPGNSGPGGNGNGNSGHGNGKGDENGGNGNGKGNSGNGNGNGNSGNGNSGNGNGSSGHGDSGHGDSGNGGNGNGNSGNGDSGNGGNGNGNSGNGNSGNGNGHGNGNGKKD